MNKKIIEINKTNEKAKKKKIYSKKNEELFRMLLTYKYKERNKMIKKINEKKICKSRNILKRKSRKIKHKPKKLKKKQEIKYENLNKKINSN